MSNGLCSPGILPFLALFFFFSLSPVLLKSQVKYRFDRVERADGRQLGHIFDIFEDEEGFIWFCTNRGLAKYDGYQFQFYYHKKEDTTTPSSSWTQAGLLDSRGRIWAGTAGGLNLMNRQTEKFKRFYHNSADSSTINNNNVRDVFEDSKGRIWIGTLRGICLYDEKNNNFQRLKAPGFAGHRHGANFSEDSKGRIWITAKKGLFLIQVDSMSARQVLPLDLPNISSSSFQTRHCYEDSAGTLWVSSNKGIWKFTPENNTYVQMDLPPELKNSNFTSILEFPKGILLLASINAGMMSWDLKNNKLHEKFPETPFEQGGMVVNSVYFFTKDSKDNLWIGLFHGANKLNLKPDHFQLHQNVIGDEDLRNYTLRVYGDPEGGVWINTMQGIYYKPYLNAPSQPITGGFLKKRAYVGVSNFHLDKKQILWLGVKNKGVFKYNLKTKSVSALEVFNKKKPDSHEVFVYGDTQNPDLLWITSSLGLFAYNQKTLEEFWYKPKDDIPELRDNYLAKTVEDTNGNLWIYSRNRLLYFDKESKKFKHYPLFFEDSKIKTNIVAIDFMNNELWVATRNTLLHYNPEADQFEPLPESIDIPDGGIISMERDNKGNFWMGSNGITQLDYDSKVIKNHKIGHKTEGLIFGHSGKCADGTLLYPSVNGLLAFQPDDMKIDSVPPKVLLRKIKVNNENLSLELAPEFIDSLILPWDNKVITFEYAGLKFDKNRLIHYKVMLEGFDDDWRTVGNKRDATYTNLNPGHYQFKVLAANADGVWMKKPALIYLQILPPYWQTNWFYALIVIVLFSIVYIIFRYYQYAQNLSRQKEVAEQSDRYKSLFLANMSHEIRTPMNAIVGMSKLMFDTQLNNKQNEYANIIKQSAENLLVIINDILDHSKIESGKYSIVHRPFELDILIRQLYKIFEIKAEEKGLVFSTEIEATTPNNLNGDATRLNQILMNLISNAIKFTNKGVVKIKVRPQQINNGQAQLLFTIIDTGTGIPEEKRERIFESFERIIESGEVEQTGTGLGLAIAQQLVKQQGGKIELKSKPGVGTTFSFTLPFEVIDAQTTAQIEPKKTPYLSKPFSFLIVEDTFFNQRLAVELLKKYFSNAQIEVANNGQIGIEKIQQKTYDLVLMDVKMPVMDGLEATRLIRNLKDKTKKSIPIIAVTANAIPEQLEQCKKAGMDDYITKPINGEDLFTKIRKILETNIT